ncbi:MAG: flagellar hook-associated protein FlgL [Pseudomonadota bacterium]
MRISTSQIYTQGIEAFQQQQVKLAKLQQQISTGVRLTKPSDDPIASSRVLELEQVISLKQQYQVNIDLAESRLEVEEATLSSVENLVFRLRELAIQGNNAALDDGSRQAVRQEMNERLDELISLANTRDAGGDYMFAGYQSRTQPFVETQTGSVTHVVYQGDQGQRSLQISETRQMAVDDPGHHLFLQIPSDQALNESAAAANTGTAVMAPASVFDNSVFVPGTYEIRFTAPGVYDVFDVGLGANIVTGAAYADSADIEFQGIRTSVTGVPAAGDVFTVSPGQYRDVFESIRTASDNFDGSMSPQQRDANTAAFLDELDGFLDRVLSVRTSIGGRLNALEGQRQTNETDILATQKTLSSLRDTDLAEAISQLTLEQTTLDAAQAVFARITSSSLFNFLR